MLKAVSIFPHKPKALLEIFYLLPIIFGLRQNSSSSAFASWVKMKIHGFTWADQDWIDCCFSKIWRIRSGSDFFFRIRIGLALKNFTVRSSLVTWRGLRSLKFLTPISLLLRLNILLLRSETFWSFGLRLLLKLQSELSKGNGYRYACGYWNLRTYSYATCDTTSALTFRDFVPRLELLSPFKDFLGI